MSDAFTPVPVTERLAPQRTCVGCRERADRHSLLRLVIVPSSAGPSGRYQVEVDTRGRRPGRGAWIHPRTACLEIAERRRALARAFRLPAPPDISLVRDHLVAQDEHQDPVAISGQHKNQTASATRPRPDETGREAMSAR